MHPSSSGEATIVAERLPARDATGGVGGGMVLSLLLHLLGLAFIVLVLPRLFLIPPAETLVPVDLVQLGDRNASPTAPDKAALPQAQARETAVETPAEPVPLAAPPPPPPEAKPAQADTEIIAGQRPIVAPEVKP